MKKILFVMLGTTIEWYDYAIITFLTPIISDVFFPTASMFSKVIFCLTIFFSGFIARPFGALILGYFADTRGKRLVLKNTIFFISLFSLATSLLPTFNQIGYLSPILFGIFRVFQGFFASAEYPCALATIFEDNKIHRWKSALVMTAVVGGMALGNLVVFLFNLIDKDLLLSFWWRAPFFIGACLGFSVYLLRRSIGFDLKSTLFYSAHEFLTKLKENKTTIFFGSLAFCFSTTLYYFSFTYIPFFLSINHPGFSYIVSIGTIANMLLISILIPVLSYYFNNNTKYLSFLSCLAFLLINNFYLSQIEMTIYSFFLIQFSLSLVISAYSAGLATFIPPLFNDSIKCTGIGLSINMFAAIVGGGMPLLLDAFTQTSFSQIFNQYFFNFLCLLSFFGFYFISFKKSVYFLPNSSHDAIS